jgi:heptosyltransferase-1
MPEPRFLVLRLGSLGDIVHTFPAVAGLRETFPGSEIIWLTHPRWKLLVESSALASEIWDVETRSFSSIRKIIRSIRHAEFDAAIDYQGLWKTAALPFLGGAKKRIGFSSATIREAGVPVLYTHRITVTTQHIADQNGELSMRAGARRGVAPFSLHISGQMESFMDGFLASMEISRYVVLSPGGGWGSKCWPAERFGALCQQVHNLLGVRCILNFGPGEEKLMKAVLAASGAAKPLPLQAELKQLMAILRKAECVVGGDTGPLHLAIALGAPAVALYGPTDPARNGPYPPESNSSAPTKNIVLRGSNAVTSHKRVDQTDPSLLELSVDTVFDAVCRQIGTRS